MIKEEFVVLYDYDAEDETELTIREGQVLFVEYDVDGWYFGRNAEGKSGNFPSNFVTKKS